MLISMRTLPAVVVIGLCVGGCAKMLGLDGLKFETEPSEAVAGSGGAEAIEPTSDSDGESDGTGAGDSEVALLQWDSLPSSWPSGTLLAFDPSGENHPNYFAYEPQSHQLSVLRLTDGDDLVSRSSWAEDLSWTHLVVLPSQNGPLVIGYDQHSGILERAFDFKADGSFSVRRAAGNIHSHLLYVPLNAGNLLFGYDRVTGFYRGIPATTDDDVSVMQGEIEAGWSSVVFLRYENVPSVLFYDELSGRFSLYEVSDQSPGLTFSFDGVAPPGQMVVGGPSQTEGLVFLYENIGGLTMLTNPMRPLGQGGESGSLEPAALASWHQRRGLVWMTSVEIDDNVAIFTFDGGVLDGVLSYLSTGDEIVR